MDRLAIRTIHNATLGKAKSLLIKSHGRLYVGNGKDRRYCSILFLVEGINLLCHSAPFGKPGHFSRSEERGYKRTQIGGAFGCAGGGAPAWGWGRVRILLMCLYRFL